MSTQTISRVYLMNVPLDNKYNHTLYFSSFAEQYRYFEDKILRSFTNLSYLKQENKIRIPAQSDSLQNYNYLMYQNEYYNDKWYFAFITKIENRADGRTDLTIEIDVIQTYLFNYEVGKCFVEREHVSDDTIGKHTIPEVLETGEFVCNELIRDENLRNYSYVLLVTEWVAGGRPLATNFGGIPSGCGAFVFENISSLVAVIQEYDNNGKGEAIIGVYMIPTKMMGEKTDDGTLQYSGHDQPITYEIEIDKQTILNGYEPKNNKLLCYPYNYINLSNNAGSSNVIRYEHFSSEKCKFEVAGVGSIGGSIKCVPLSYKGLQRIQEEGIMCGKFPTLSWSSDLYTNWLTQNAVNIGLGIGSSAVAMIGGLATGNIIASGGGALSIANQLGQIYEMSFTPPSAKGNVNSGDINSAYKMNTFYFYKMSIKKEYAEVIDNYFSMYGYKVSALKVPNKNHRRFYWYTKTIEANITGTTVPREHLNKIIEAYNNGITFWKSNTTFRSYPDDNSIV